MNNEKKKQRKTRINAFDILIILLVVVCIAGLIVRNTIVEKLENVTSYASYYVFFDAESVSYASTVALESTHDDSNGGNWVYLDDGITKVGVMTKGEGSASENLAVTISDVYVKDSSGKTVLAQYADIEKDKDRITYDVKDIIVLAEGFISSETGSFLLGGKIAIAPGSVLKVQTKYGDFELKVTSIEHAPAAK